jgi:hypothetical protein
MLLGVFNTEPREQNPPWYALDGHGNIFFMHCNHLPTPGLCQIFELGIDRANEVELFFAPPAFELFFPSDGVADVLVAFKVEQALTPLFRSETFERALFMLHNSLIQIAGDADVKRACIAAEDVDVATGHGRC